jgi:hypothetical protein
MIKSYCIGGDSWSCGEWLVDKFLPGGKQYDLHRLLLNKNKIVSDISFPGKDNQYTILKLKEHLDNSPLEYDFVIWFQSDPLRRPVFIEQLKSAKDFSLDYRYFVETSNSYLEDDYAHLNDIGRTVYCIGGLSKINSTLISKYNNLKVLVESFPEILFPNSPHPSLCLGLWMKHIERQVQLDSLEKIRQDHAAMMKWASPECSKFFNIGDSHPNKRAYKLLLEYILSIKQ